MGLRMGETRERKVVDRRVAIALGIICIVLASCLVWAIVVISSLNSQISSLISQLGATPTTVNEITHDTSAWVSKTVVVNGRINGPIMTPGDMQLPYSYELSSGGQTVGLSLSASVTLNPSVYTNESDGYTFQWTSNGSVQVPFYVCIFNGSLTLSVYGVVKKGETTYGWGMPSQVTYYIEAEKVEMA
jgi:hypothetical protein